MPQITIDGQAFDFEGQGYLLQFALDNGVDIPYFCYHPAMSIPTNCRMCLVDVGFPMKDRATGEPVLDENGVQKIQWGRKPNTACNTPLAPDMVVRTSKTSPVIEKAQKGVLEFMLINHPLDCPICDQAGECPLQINTYNYGPEGSRYELEKIHKPKRIQLGPNVTLDAERCINCTRCTRFTEEISGTNQLTIMQRGEKNYPVAAPGEVFDDPYSMNVIDLCPVGALTSTDHRFKARVWEMNYTPSVCTGCAQNCSIDVWVRDNQVLRLTPRENREVNDFWMCDAGRLDYLRYNENRVSGIKIKGDVPIDFAEGMTWAAQLLDGAKGNILFVGSAHSSLETLYSLKIFAEALGQNGPLPYVQHENADFGDELLRKNDVTPNRGGAELLGYEAVGLEELKTRAQGATLVFVLQDNAVAEALLPVVGEKRLMVGAANYFPGHENVDLLLPIATEIEGKSTFINQGGHAQLTLQAKQIRQMTPDMWMEMPKSRLDAGGVAIDNWRHPEYIVDCLPGWLLLSRLAQGMGLEQAVYLKHSDLFNKLRDLYSDQLSGIQLRRLNRKESFKHSQLEFALR